MKTFGRILLFLVIVSTLGFGLSRSPIQTYEKPKETFGYADAPEMSYLKMVDVQEGNLLAPFVRIALYMPRGTPEENLVEDILAAYKWGTSKFKPVKCGKDYPPEIENCNLGRVEIWLLFRDKPIPTSQGPQPNTFLIVARMELDQFFIETLLQRGVINMDQLLSFHESVAQQTYGTGGSVRLAQGASTFRGFENMK